MGYHGVKGHADLLRDPHTNSIINSNDSDGLSDTFVPQTNSYGFGDDVEFKDYVFTVDNLPSFRTYRIKLILTSTSQVYVPRIKDLRVIALA